MTILGRDSPTITAVQHDLMRALWLKNCSQGKKAWHILGGAIRMAQDLGLHLQSKVYQKAESEVEETLSQLWYDEYKRRLWIKLFSWDSHMAFTLSRPRTINCSDCTIRTPLDCDIPADPSSTVPTALAEHDPPSAFTPHLFQYAVCQQMHKAMTLGADKPHLKDYTIIKTVNDQIISLVDDLPPAHRPNNPDTSWDARYPNIPKQRQQIVTAANSFLMALHRPHAGAYAASRQAALQAALNTLDAQERLFNQMGTRYYNIHALSFYTLDAGIFLAVTAIKYPPTDLALLDLIHDALRKAIYRLDLAQRNIQLAKSGGQILKLCYRKMEKSGFYYGSLSAQDNSTHDVDRTSLLHCSDEAAPSDTWMGVQSSLPSARHPNLSAATVDIDQLYGAIRFEDLIEPQFDMESWVQQMNQSVEPAEDLAWI
ncbi:hypothetical protein OIDMADRAFT_166834 [Oidiodendron maius Zn]|uniref:Xylanolytic transcriptional activator regulatory domain-containing protein n=1 Tax=Oidiodendron maius (strain Zn) TaxID=913774 RepID=A0A0C3CJU2_OIDMZ|nr:hypothetical protein OIDMADRAFT_166834 [Oidiodendron maius Zn]